MYRHDHFTTLRRRLLLLACATAGMLLGGAHAATLQVTVLDKDGRPTPDAVVMVVPGAAGVPKNPPPLRALISQEKMQFVPAVTVVSPGAVVRFVNADPWDHHVRLTANANANATAMATSTDAQALRLEGRADGKASKAVEVTLSQSGATGATLLGCFIHGSMSGHIYVAESPWTVKTGADGVATLEDVPEGAATVRVWHAVQLLEPTPQKLVLGATAGQLTFKLDFAPRRRRG